MAGIDKYFWRGIKEDMAKIVDVMARIDEFSHLDVMRITGWICSDARMIGPRMRNLKEIIFSNSLGVEKYKKVFETIDDPLYRLDSPYRAHKEARYGQSEDARCRPECAMTKFNEVSAQIVQQEADREAERALRQAKLKLLKQSNPKNVQITVDDSEVISEDITRKVLESLSDPKVAEGKRFVLVGCDDKPLEGEFASKVNEIVNAVTEYADNAVVKKSEHVSESDVDMDIDVVEDTLE